MSQLIPPNAPRLPTPGAEYDVQQQNLFANALRLYFNQIDGVLREVLIGFNHYGTFYSASTLTNPVANTANTIPWTNTLEAFGIAIDAGDNTRINVVRGGVYAISFSIQLDASGGPAATIDVWLRKNGVTDVAGSCARWVVTSGTDEKVATRTLNITADPGDWFQVVWAGTSTSTVLAAFAAAPPVPAIPAATIAIQYVYPNGRSG